MTLREDEARAVEELERAWGLRSDGSRPTAKREEQLQMQLSITDRGEPDDGAAPPNFLLGKQSEYEEYSLPSPRTLWRRMLDDVAATAITAFVVSVLTALTILAVVMRR